MCDCVSAPYSVYHIITVCDYNNKSLQNSCANEIIVNRLFFVSIFTLLHTMISRKKIDVFRLACPPSKCVCLSEVYQSKHYVSNTKCSEKKTFAYLSTQKQMCGLF